MLPIAGELRFPAGLGGNRLRARRGGQSGRICGAATRDPVCALHAGADHPRPLARRTASGLHCRPRARARDGHRAVLRSAARGAARDHSTDRHRVLPGDRTDHPPRASRGADPLRGLHPQPARRRLRPGDRQSAFRGPHRSGRPDDRDPRPPPARLFYRPLDRAAAAGRHRPLRDQHRHDGQGEPDRARAHRLDGRPDRRRAPARGQHARDRRHRRRGRRARLSAPRGGSGAQRLTLDGPCRNRAAERR